MTPGKIMRWRSRRTVISEIPWGFTIFWLEIRQRMHIMMSMRMRKKGTFDTEKGIIVGNIRMGFGHYRISMAMASAAKAMGYTPYWMDLNSYGETTCTKSDRCTE